MRASQNVLSAKRVAAIREAIKIATISGQTPLRSLTDSGRAMDMQDQFADAHADTDAALLAADAERVVGIALRAVRPRTADVIRRHLGVGVEEETLTVIGKAHELSRERVRQLENAGLVVMRKALRARGIDCAAAAGCSA